MKIRFYFMALLITTFLLSCNAQKAEGVERITIETLKETVIGKELQLIDVRRPDEYAKGYIDDAVNIDIADLDIFKQEIAKLDKTKPIYLYCHGGRRSNNAAKVVRELGFDTIYDFSGGWKVWSKNR